MGIHMTARTESALDLFKKYCGRFPQIEMEPAGFTSDVLSTRILLRPVRRGKPIGMDQKITQYPYIDVVECGFQPLIQMRATGTAPSVQLEAKYADVAREFLLKRRFRLRVCTHPALLPRYYSISLREKPDFPATFTTYPACPRGMVINPSDIYHRAYLHWSAFVPEGSPEHAAICAALDLAERANAKPLPAGEAEIIQLQTRLRDMIAQVPV